MNGHHNPPILQMKNISVSYGNYTALNGVDFDLFPGEIHALVGEHRAGKSTLVKLLSGAARKDRGQILYKGREIEYFTPRTAAITHKIGILYQESHLIPTMTAVENIFTGRDLTVWGIGLRKKEMERRAKELFDSLGTAIELNVPLKYLAEADRHIVELVKMLSIDPDVMIFDEISSRLTPEEMENIYKLLFMFKDQGKSIIYISHNMDEIFDFADRVTILNNGYRRGTEEIKDLDRVTLLKLTYSYVLSREELQSNNRELYLLKKYNESIIKNLPEGVIILAPDMTINLINYAAISLLGLDERDIINEPIQSVLYPERFEDAEEMLDMIQEHVEDFWDNVEFDDGKILKIHVSPFKDEDYKFLGTIIIIEDVSKERHFNDYLLRTQKLASIAELAAGVAHEINNPLGIIRNYITLLQRKESVDVDSEQKLTKIEGELSRIGTIIDSLLSFSKRKQLPMIRCDLAAILDETLLLLGHKVKEKQIDLRWTPPDFEVPIIGDDNKLKQVFMNLLVNSIEAVTYNGLVQVALSIKQDEKSVEVAITDDGYGIPEEVRVKIFDPFFTTKIGKKNTGLGLAICQHIIESHQGIITCASRDTTTFTIRLPLAEN